MKVVLDFGHGGTDSGCRSVVDGTFESNLVLEIGLMVRELLEPYVDVLLTRDSDDFKSLSQRCRESNSWGATIFCSLHINFASSEAKGFEVFTSGSVESIKLANCLGFRHMEAHKDQRNRGVKKAGYYVLKYTQAPAILLEYGFFSSPDEAVFLTKEETKTSIAKSTMLGILDYFNIKPNKTQLTVEQRIARLEDHLGL